MTRRVRIRVTCGSSDVGWIWAERRLLTRRPTAYAFPCFPPLSSPDEPARVSFPEPVRVEVIYPPDAEPAFVARPEDVDRLRRTPGWSDA